MKDTFIIRTEWYKSIAKLPAEEQAVIFRNLFEYHAGNVEGIQTPSLATELVWALIEPTLARNIQSYDRRCETSAANGARGGRPKKEEPKKPNPEPNKPNVKPNNPDSECESDCDSESDKKKKVIKIAYRQNVKLTKDENDKLVREYGEAFVNACYDFLSDYKYEKGYKTKDDNRTIRRWVVEAVEKKGATVIPMHPPLRPTADQEHLTDRRAYLGLDD